MRVPQAGPSRSVRQPAVPAGRRARRSSRCSGSSTSPRSSTRRTSCSKARRAAGLVVQLLVYRTPQFVYYVIPIATLLSVLVTFGLLSRTSELTVMKACGVSLYRAAACRSSCCRSSGACSCSALDQDVLARANRRAGAIDDVIRDRPSHTFSPLNRRWMIGRDGSIYHYGFFDTAHRTLATLTVYRLLPGAWRLASQTQANTAEYHDEGWDGGPRLDAGLQRRHGALAPVRAGALALDPPDYFATEDADTDMMTAAAAAPHGRRARLERLQLPAAAGGAAAQDRLPARHVRHDAARRPVRRDDGPPRQRCTGSGSASPSRCSTGW